MKFRNETEKNSPNYYAIIPAKVRYDNEICANAKLLYGEITALTNKEGYCWASNEYFAKLYNVSTRSITEWISQLIKRNHIKSQLIFDSKEMKTKERRLSLVEENFYNQVEDNFQHNNINNNNNYIEENFYIKESFDKLWELYPKKENKNQAFKSYSYKVEEFKKLGCEEKLINKAFWYKLVEYKEKIREQNTDDKYIKQGYNFFNSVLEDFSSSSMLESYVEKKEREVLN